MFRAASIALLALALALPTAAASEPIAGAGLGPGATLVTGTQTPPRYYFYVIVSPPETPHAAGASDDCFKPKDPRQQPPPLEQAILLLAEKVRSWDPIQAPRISPWFPTCFAGTFQNPLVRGRVSYDFPTGRYYIQFQADRVPVSPGLPEGLGAPPFGMAIGLNDVSTEWNAAAGAAVTGTTGVGTMADCETCPPPCC